MRFSEDYIDELKARIRVSDVVGRHVKLKRQGREFAGLSPFTNEKTPSFFVNDEKGFYHCFSSGGHGDAIGFLMEIEGLSFVEAIESLANMVGMSLPAVDPDAARQAAQNKKTISWIEEAQLFFAKCLRRDIGKEARQYLQGRGLVESDWERFGLGFAPDSFQALRDELIAKGGSLSQLVEAGLLIEPEARDGQTNRQSNKQPWDRFRNRIMFPITDSRGRMIAFGGRAMEKDAKAKYLNSPETNLFHKGRVLYHYPPARKALAAPQNPARGLIVAEGYMDVIALARAGFEHAVAPLGTALTEDQFALLWRAGPEPILCFDGDRAGLRAAYRSVERALPLITPSQSVRFAMLTDGLDPDDLIQQRGAQAMREVLEKAVPLVDMLWRRELEAEDLSTPEAKAGLKDRLFKLLYQIKHEGVRAQYKSALLARFDKAFGNQYQSSSWRGNRRGFGSRRPNAPPSSQLKAKMAAYKAQNADRGAGERRLMGAIIEHPELLEHIDEFFFTLDFDTPELKSLQNCIMSYWRDAIAVDKNAIRAHIEAHGHSRTLNLFTSFGKATTGIALAGPGADLAVLEKEWLREAVIHQELDVAEAQRAEFRDRMSAVLRKGDREAMLKLMRGAAAAKRQLAASAS